MKTIYKYELKPVCAISLPKGAIVRAVDTQANQKLCMWVEIDTNEIEKELRTFVVFGTGHTIESTSGGELKYIGTAQMDDGADGFVWHVYEEV